MIHQRSFRKKPDSASATAIFRLMATNRNTSVLTIDADEDRVVDELDVALGLMREPERVEDRVDDEEREHEQIGNDEDDSPELPGS